MWHFRGLGLQGSIRGPEVLHGLGMELTCSSCSACVAHISGEMAGLEQEAMERLRNEEVEEPEESEAQRRLWPLGP